MKAITMIIENTKTLSMVVIFTVVSTLHTTLGFLVLDHQYDFVKRLTRPFSHDRYKLMKVVGLAVKMASVHTDKIVRTERNGTELANCVREAKAGCKLLLLEEKN